MVDGQKNSNQSDFEQKLWVTTQTSFSLEVRKNAQNLLASIEASKTPKAQTPGIVEAVLKFVHRFV